jgi:NodT family efflux transporter outer membrane factor (OMF) lipoprotein
MKKRFLQITSLSVFLAACSFAPKYQLPPLVMPLEYKETGPWVETKPGLEELTLHQPWWALFKDPLLNSLEERLNCENIDLKIALDKYESARAAAQVTRAALFPDIESIDAIARDKSSASVTQTTKNLTKNTFLVTAVMSYEVDLWGRVRNSVLSSNSLAKASGYDLAALEISLHAELAQDYFQLRGFDQNQKVLDTVVKAYDKALYLTRQRHKWGMVAEADVDAAITQFENAKTAAKENLLKRGQLEHAIAVLLGEVPASLTLKSRIAPFHLATVSPNLPATLLLRRPDVAASNERVRSANAQIGVARAAFFPQINLVNLIGAESNKLSNLFTTANMIWALGTSTALTLVQPQISQVIFDGFKRQGLLREAKANYFEAVNTYKKTVLNAFKEVEDSLVAIHRLDQEKFSQTKSTIAAKRALYHANQQYKGGLITYIEVVVYENAALQSQLALIDINTRRQLASVDLIKALGGGW